MTIATIESAPLPDRMQYARALAEASIIPRAFQQRPADVLVAIEYGNALGIAPIVALSEINVINGTPSLSASLMAALARKAGHKVRVSGEGNSVTCEIIRADDPDFTHSATWDEKKARDAGLWGKGHWSKDPGTMLRWRAVSECVRFACSEVLGGLKYTPEEVRDFSPSVTPTPAPAQHTVTQVRSLSDAVGEHKEQQAVWTQQEAASPDSPAEAAEESPLRTKAQATKLAVLMRNLGMDDRDEAMALFSSIIGRELASTKDLTVAEASQVIERLEDAERVAADPVTGEVVEEEDGWPAPALPGSAA